MADIFHWGKGVIRNEKLYGLGIPPRLSYGSCHMQVRTEKKKHTVLSFIHENLGSWSPNPYWNPTSMNELRHAGKWDKVLWKVGVLNITPVTTHDHSLASLPSAYTAGLINCSITIRTRAQCYSWTGPTYLPHNWNDWTTLCQGEFQKWIRCVRKKWRRGIKKKEGRNASYGVYRGSLIILA